MNFELLLESLGPHKATSIDSSEHFLYVGTDNGRVLVYSLQPRKDAREKCFMLTSHDLCYGEKDVNQVLAVEEFGVVFILCDGNLTMHHMETMQVVYELEEAKGCSVFCIDKQHHEGYGRVCAAVKRRLVGYEFNQYACDLLGQFELPDIIHSLSWYGDHIFLGHKQSYDALNFQTGLPNELALSAMAEPDFSFSGKFFPLVLHMDCTEEILLRSNIEPNIYAFVQAAGDGLGQQTRPSVHWSDLPLAIGACYPYIVAVFPRCVFVYSLYSRTLTQRFSLASTPSSPLGVRSQSHFRWASADSSDEDDDGQRKYLVAGSRWRVVVSNEECVWVLTPQPLNNQIIEFFQELKLAESFDLFDKLFHSHELEKELKASKIHEAAAFTLTLRILFEESLRQFLEEDLGPCQGLEEASGEPAASGNAGSRKIAEYLVAKIHEAVDSPPKFQEESLGSTKIVVLENHFDPLRNGEEDEASEVLGFLDNLHRRVPKDDVSGTCQQIDALKAILRKVRKRRIGRLAEETRTANFDKSQLLIFIRQMIARLKAAVGEQLQEKDGSSEFADIDAQFATLRQKVEEMLRDLQSKQVQEKLAQEASAQAPPPLSSSSSPPSRASLSAVPTAPAKLTGGMEDLPADPLANSYEGPEFDGPIFVAESTPTLEALYRKSMMVTMQAGIRQSMEGLAYEQEFYVLDDLDFETTKHYEVKVADSQHEEAAPKSPGTPSSQGPASSPAPPKCVRFKEYAPQVFRRLRQRFNFEDDGSFMESLCGSTSLQDMMTNSRSRSLFFKSTDEKYIIKTLNRTETKLLRSILKPYTEYVMGMPNTLLPAFLSLYRFTNKHKDKQKIYAVVMKNVFNTDLKICERYDLKGSTIARSVGRPQGDVQEYDYFGDGSSGLALKDNDLQESVRIGAELKERLIEQLKSDCGFLNSFNIMDYSLLLGIHREDPTEALLTRSLGLPSSTTDIKAHQLGFNMSIFQSHRGGMLAVDPPPTPASAHPPEDDEAPSAALDDAEAPLAQDKPKTVYFVGLIDALQQYDFSKKFENKVKSIRYLTKADQVSAVDSMTYYHRFIGYMNRIFQ